MWFWHVLALRFGTTVAELKSRMSRAEFMRWIEFQRRNPIDPNAQLRALAMVAHTVACSNSKHPPQFEKFADFVIPKVEDDEADADKLWLAFMNMSPG